MINSDLYVILFGLASAICWGAGDFSGGIATKRSNVYGVVLTSQIIGTVLLAVAALLLAEEMPDMYSIFWGSIAGICGCLGLLALYKGLSIGKMGIVAPVAAVVTAIVPMVFSIFTEGMPPSYRFAGFAIAFAGVWLISGSENTTDTVLNDFSLPLIAGIGFGFFLIAIDHVSKHAILWPLVASRLASVGMLMGIHILKRQYGLPTRNLLPLVLLAGIFDTAGNTFFALASQAGRLDIAAVVSSLYPGATVMLAWIILKERIRLRQWIGIFASLAAIIFISG
ncbi:EamA family transporter [Methanomethylovorans sp.]|uniref:EamA family transporter n=1 Tax=Methanomethylovorans sp. TaxID=2758717 RepID=UPI00351C228C